MKTAILKINLFQFQELSDEAKTKAIEEHFYFLNSLGIEAENESGQMITEEYEPSESEVVESIEINEYFFYEDGEQAHTVTYTGKHPLSGSTVYQHKDQRIFI